jgi:V/A-type H+-transporting ATPase subunit D
VRKGIDLLTRKRSALVADLFRVARPAVEARREMLEHAARAYGALLGAVASHGPALDALGWPTRQVETEVRVAETWGIATAEVVRLTPVRRTLAARGQSPGLTGPAAGTATDAFEQLVELLVDSAGLELRLRRLATALATTSRQVNMLEQRVAPALEAAIGTVAQQLEEREREEHTRLRLLFRRPGDPAEEAHPTNGSG